MAQASERYVQVERGHDGVAVVRLDRPMANALPIEMVRQLTWSPRGWWTTRPARLSSGAAGSGATDRRNVSSP